MERPNRAADHIPPNWHSVCGHVVGAVPVNNVCTGDLSEDAERGRKSSGSKISNLHMSPNHLNRIRIRLYDLSTAHRMVRRPLCSSILGRRAPANKRQIAGSGGPETRRSDNAEEVRG